MDRETPSISGMTVLLEALWFAARKHSNQRRKNPGRTPYINHLLEVAHLLWFVGKIRDENVLAAAVLHDTVEDTDTSFEELTQRFGTKIRNIVAEVTDDWNLPKQERKRRQVTRAPHISMEAKLVKLADKISNIRDIRDDPPEGWPDERQVAYFHWAKNVVDGIRGANADLEAAFDEIYQGYFQSREPAHS